MSERNLQILNCIFSEIAKIFLLIVQCANIFLVPHDKKKLYLKSKINVLTELFQRVEE